MKYYKYKMNMTVLNFLCILLFFPLYIIICLLNLNSSINFTFFIVYFLWMFLHEFLHGIGFLIGGVDRRNVLYGACLEKGIMYSMCKQKIGKNNIIISCLFPFFVIGVFAFFLGIIINNRILQCLSLFNIIGSIGDLVMFFDFVFLPDFMYMDFDDCTGFVLFSENDLSKYKLFGLDLVEIGSSDKLESSCYYKKINFSKFSILIFLLLFIMLIFVVLKMVIA